MWCSWVDTNVRLASEVSTAEVAEDAKLAEVDESAEQGAASVTVAVTVITQEAGQCVRGHAAANVENAVTASANVRREGDIIGYSRVRCM
jgi:hypothetical protein